MGPPLGCSHLKPSGAAWFLSHFRPLSGERAGRDDRPKASLPHPHRCDEKQRGGGSISAPAPNLAPLPARERYRVLKLHHVPALAWVCPPALFARTAQAATL